MKDETMQSDEVKIIFEEGDNTRALRGVITDEDDYFIWIQRSDGLFKIGKKYIIKIEELKHDN